MRRRSRPAQRQLVFPFLARWQRLERSFKWAIVLATVGLAGLMIGASAPAQRAIRSFGEQARQFALRNIIGLGPTREEIDALRRVSRERTVEATHDSLTQYYNEKATPAMRRLFDAAAMSPTSGLIGVGRPTDGFLLSSEVFEIDDSGRSYRLRPNMRSVWLRQVTLREGPFGLFLVPDTSEVRSAAEAADAIVDETSRQITNSWGLRGPEPDLSAKLRGIVLGDSFMQGMFNSDEHTPPLDLERSLVALGFPSVSILNTGHIGYAPEQYYHTLRAYGDRFKPHFIVVSVCPNDFGAGMDVINGGGDDWDEARHWLEQILVWCHARSIPCLVVPAPVDQQILGVRRDAYYPGRVAGVFGGGTFSLCNPFDAFVDAHLKALREGFPAGESSLFNSQIDDNHFSPKGSRLWGEIVARRVALLLSPRVARNARDGS